MPLLPLSLESENAFLAYYGWHGITSAKSSTSHGASLLHYWFTAVDCILLREDQIFPEISRVARLIAHCSHLGRIRSMDTPSFQTSAVHPASPSQTVTIYAGDRELLAEWEAPPGAIGVVILAEGIGGSRRNPKDQYVARVLRQSGMATLLVDLLTEDEQHRHRLSHALHFDIPLLTERLVRATRWVESQSARPQLKIGYFASSTGAAAALVSAARFGRKISAIVSRGGRPDLAMAALPKVVSPTLLIVGSHDDFGIQFNRTAERTLSCESDLFLLAGATHWFSERGSIEEVAGRSACWFNRHFQHRK